MHKESKKVFKKALEVLKGGIPKPAEDYEYCEWVDKCNCEIK